MGRIEHTDYSWEKVGTTQKQRDPVEQTQLKQYLEYNLREFRSAGSLADPAWTSKVKIRRLHTANYSHPIKYSE